MGLTIPVNAHLINLGLGPKYDLVFCRKLNNSCVHLSVCALTWFFQLNLLSIVTPKYLVLSTVLSFLLLIFRLLIIFLLLGANIMLTVFSGLKAICL